MLLILLTQLNKKYAEKMTNIENFNDIKVILHFEPDKGHNGISMDEAIEFLYSLLGEKVN